MIPFRNNTYTVPTNLNYYRILHCTHICQHFVPWIHYVTNVQVQTFGKKHQTRKNTPVFFTSYPLEKKTHFVLESGQYSKIGQRLVHVHYPCLQRIHANLHAAAFSQMCWTRPTNCSLICKFYFENYVKAKNFVLTRMVVQGYVDFR